ncbi:MAG: pyridoxal 5'-phosphate synthase glutaminase subunit PdxT [Spirochaetes bacterium]|nr:pyridoxal 5'-phosphate synthase glutaminase subunit PdxT [Spirochaetota bacterium]
MVKVGVLALQGDFEKHIETLDRLQVSSVEVREKSQLDKIDGLIIPGGESTTIGKLLVRYELMEPLRNFAKAGKPIFGTCAGAILLAKEIEGSNQDRIGVLDIAVKRNAYGRQIESFEADIFVPKIGELPVRGVFIRAPIIKHVKDGVEVLSRFADNPVLVKQGKILAATFHPELTNDTRIHAFFLSLFSA